MMKVFFTLYICLLLFSCQDIRNESNSEKSIESISANQQREYLQDPSLPNAIELIAADEALVIFTETLMGADLIEELQGAGPYTIFAPSDEAFGKLPVEKIESLMMSKNSAQLQTFVSYHIHKGFWKSKDQKRSLKTIQGENIEINFTDDGILINDARILGADLDAANGVIHIIDKVLHIEEL